MEIFRDRGMIAGFRLEDPFGPSSLITHCGEALIGSLFSVGWHRHDGAEAVYLESGTLKWQIGNKQYEQRGGELFVSLPGERHRSIGTPRGSQPLTFVGWRVRPGGQLATRLVADMRSTGRRLFPHAHEAGAVLGNIVRQAARGDSTPLRRETAGSFLQALLAVVLQASSALSDGRAEDSVAHSFAVEKALNYMRANLSAPAAVADLAALAGLRPSQFHAVFRREIGEPPAAHHRQLRLTHSREMLVHQEYSVAQIAMACGFSSSQHFSNEFRRAFGRSPRAYRGSK